MGILKEFEEQASGEEDPSAWIAQQARATAPAGARSTEAPEERLCKRIAWLNDKAQLCSPIVVDLVLPSLLAIDVKKAMAVLKALEENATTILDPCSYITSAAEEAAADQPGLDSSAEGMTHIGL